MSAAGCISSSIKSKLFYVEHYNFKLIITPITCQTPIILSLLLQDIPFYANFFLLADSYYEYRITGAIQKSKRTFLCGNSVLE